MQLLHMDIKMQRCTGDLQLTFGCNDAVKWPVVDELSGTSTRMTRIMLGWKYLRIADF
ncbi:hypothetical protein MGAST_21575 [Mycobacterium gastri 'Wayne']|nr:hypothetical protein MGAST_21575 [Mycobacterium gastri 'Wayne']